MMTATNRDPACPRVTLRLTAGDDGDAFDSWVRQDSAKFPADRNKTEEAA